ncbi:MAG TPA: hypothetical protein VIK89_15935 [Cytophagaceae bacterium]
MGKHLYIILFFLPFLVSAQTEEKMLLLDHDIRIEATEAVNDMYNFKFDKAEKEFLKLKTKYPEHPIAYYLMGLSCWWKMMPYPNESEYIKKVENIFLAYMDTSITLAEKMYKANPKNPEASFFLCASHGLKGNYYGESGKYIKSAFSTKEVFNYFKNLSENNELSPEFLFGDAIFNYYAVWIREEYPQLKPILAFFPKGDKELGIKQLKEVSYNAFYTRTEAQYYLMKIYNDQNKGEEALGVARYLATTFPDNAYFQRMYARYAFTEGKWKEAEEVSTSIMYKYNIGMPGYEEVSARYASFILGYINRRYYHNNEKAKEFYNKTIIFAAKTGNSKKDYNLIAISDLAKIAHEANDIASARQYYKTLLDYADRKSEKYKEAKQYLSENKKK